MNDPLIIKKAQNGDENAFADIVVLYKKQLYQTAVIILGNKADADDVVQETFLKAYKNIGQFRGESKFYTWINRILVNTCNELFNKKTRWFNFFNKYKMMHAEYEKEMISNWQDKYVNLYRVAKSMEKLDIISRQVIYYKYFEECTDEETAKIMDCPVGTIYSRVNAAKNRLKYLLN